MASSFGNPGANAMAGGTGVVQTGPDIEDIRTEVCLATEELD